ncbi:MaoC/PaaZ C-terminal domain-containing protein [Micromonospora sp. M12]
MVTVDGDEMVAFARRFDPQWYHVDADLAGASRHGGLIASGFYTVSLFMRAYVDHLLSRAAADASPAWRSCAGSPRYAPATGSRSGPT